MQTTYLLTYLCTAAVSASDFPSTEFVRRRVQQFQKCFTSAATRLFSTLPLDVRLSSLALAVRAVTHESRAASSPRYERVTLADFLQTTTQASIQLCRQSIYNVRTFAHLSMTLKFTGLPQVAEIHFRAKFLQANCNNL